MECQQHKSGQMPMYRQSQQHQKPTMVLGLVIAGRSSTEIAEALTVSQSTVKTHLGHILDKLGLWDRSRRSCSAASTA